MGPILQGARSRWGKLNILLYFDEMVDISDVLISEEVGQVRGHCDNTSQHLETSMIGRVSDFSADVLDRSYREDLFKTFSLLMTSYY